MCKRCFLKCVPSKDVSRGIPSGCVPLGAVLSLGVPSRGIPSSGLPSRSIPSRGVPARLTNRGGDSGELGGYRLPLEHASPPYRKVLNFLGLRVVQGVCSGRKAGNPGKAFLSFFKL